LAPRPVLALDRAGGGALAQDLGGHALADLALGMAVLQQQQVGVRVHVDEAGGDDQPGGVEGAPGRPRHPADGGDAIAAHGNVAAEPRVAAAVDDGSVADEQVVGRFGRRGRRRQGQRQDRDEVSALHRTLRWISPRHPAPGRSPG
jgi:hypothetical protein